MLAGVFYLNLLLQLKPFRGLLVEIDRDTPYEFVDYSCLQSCVLFEGEISVSFVNCAFWGLFPPLLTSIKAWLHLACFMVQVVKVLSASVLRKVCYHLSFCMELVDWQLCQGPLVGSESSCPNTC